MKQSKKLKTPSRARANAASRKRAALIPEHVIAHFTQKYKEHPYVSELCTAEQYFSGHLYMVTMHVDHRSQKPVTQPLEVAGKWYFKLIQKLLGQSVHKKRAMQPLAYAFVDFEGSKYGANTMSGAHVHAMLLVEPDKQKQDFDDWHSRGDLTFGMGEVTNIDIRPFKLGRKTSTEVVSYAMKGFSQTPDTLAIKQDLWRVLSEPKQRLPKRIMKKRAKAIQR